MFLLAALVGCLLALTTEARIGNCSELPFYTETSQCLLFKVICETNKYEVRHYEAAKWVTTTEGAWSMDFACMNAFMRLFEYISGENKNGYTSHYNGGKGFEMIDLNLTLYYVIEPGQKIEMTAPVVIKIDEEKKWFWETKQYTMSFLLPKEHQANPPMPTDNQVFISDTPAFNVYVRSYGGWMTSWTDCHHKEALMYDLKKDGASFKGDSHLGVGYNSPMTLWWNRHNEVWVIAEGNPVCSSSEEMD